jgi:D-glycero-D-manno-heptose 1,7-bisphosphate phosphatase
MKARALLLDRDGVINKEINYLFQKKDFIFNHGIFKLCRKYQNKGYKLIVITNQAGIARGLYKESDYLLLTQWMINEFLNRGIVIHKVYHCPHYPGLTGLCSCRKPHPGMINKSEKEFNLDLSKSILIGDKISDIEAGKNAGVGLNILITPNKIPKELL